MSSYSAPPRVSATRDKGGDFKPSCPGLYATTVLKADYVERDYDETIFTAAQCKQLSFKVECHLSTAFVTASSKWVVPAGLVNKGGRASDTRYPFSSSPSARLGKNL